MLRRTYGEYGQAEAAGRVLLQVGRLELDLSAGEVRLFGQAVTQPLGRGLPALAAPAGGTAMSKRLLGIFLRDRLGLAPPTTPTGHLDSRSSRSLMEALERLNAESQTTTLMVTHDPVSASYCRRILFIKDGRPFTEVRRGADRPAFFQQILDVLSVMGGESYELTYARR